MDDATRQGLLQILGNAMSDLSEEAYCGGWVADTQYVVPELCRRAVATGRAQDWHGAEITPTLARGLQTIADQIGAWANYDTATDGYVPFQPFPIPPEYLEALDWNQAREAARRARLNNG